MTVIKIFPHVILSKTYLHMMNVMYVHVHVDALLSIGPNLNSLA